MSSNKESLLRKIKELAKNGFGGEQTNAQELLKSLMKRYGITDDQLDDNPIVVWKYKIPGNKELFFQIFRLTIDDMGLKDSELKAYKIKKYYEFHTSLAFKMEFTTAYEFYAARYAEDLKIFYLAFLKKNTLLIQRKASDKDATDDEINMHKKASMMSLGLDKHNRYKQIESGKKT